MKKVKKIIITLISVIIIAIITIITYNVFAEEKLLIKDIKYAYDSVYNTGILYSDNRLLTWGNSGDDVIYENVKDYIMLNNSKQKPIILTTDGKLKVNLDGNNKKIAQQTCQTYGSNWHAKHSGETPSIYENNKWYCCTESSNFSECFESDIEYVDFETKEIENVTSFDYQYSSYTGENLIYMDNQKNLYDIDGLIASNVKQFVLDREGGEFVNMLGEGYHFVNYLTESGELYTNGFEIFDLEQIENIEEIMSTNPKYIKIADNVSQIGENYYITTTGDMYFFGILNVTEEIYTLKLSSNVKNVLYAFDNYLSVLFYIEDTDGNKKILTYGYESSPQEIQTSIDIKSIEGHFEQEEEVYKNAYLILDKNGTLYKIIDNKIEEIEKNVKEIKKASTDYELEEYQTFMADYYILNNDNELMYKCYNLSFCETNGFVELFVDIPKLEINKSYKVIENIQTAQYILYGIMITNENKVLRIGYSKYNEFKDGIIGRENYEKIPIQIDELINNGKEIIPIGIIDEVPTKGIVGEWKFIDPHFYPLNIDHYDMDFISEDESIAIYEKEGISYLKEGETRLCYISNLYNIEKCANLTVYPQISSVSVREGTNIDMTTYKGKVINLDIIPNNTLVELLNYSIDYPNEIERDLRIEQLRYYDEEKEEYVYLEKNQFYIEFYNPGIYTITINDNNENYSVDVQFNVTTKVSWIDYDIREDNFDGVSTAFMFLNEENTLYVSAEAFPTYASNKKLKWKSTNEKVATVDQNGIITAHDVGETRIIIESEDGNATESFKLLVYDYSKQNRPGDINADGQVNILDVIKLRRHLAGLEVFNNEEN